MEYMITRMNSDELYHHGIKGQRWGIRRYQNADGSLTSAGRQKLRNWKHKQYQKSDKRYHVESWKKRADKAVSKLDELKKNDRSTEKQIDKASKNATKKLTKYYVAKGYAQIEKSAISKKTLSDVRIETIQKGALFVGGMATGTVIPMPINMALKTGGSVLIKRYNRGISSKRTKNVRKRATRRANREIQKL